MFFFTYRLNLRPVFFVLRVLGQAARWKYASFVLTQLTPLDTGPEMFQIVSVFVGRVSTEMKVSQIPFTRLAKHVIWVLFRRVSSTKIALRVLRGRTHL